MYTHIYLVIDGTCDGVVNVLFPGYIVIRTNIVSKNTGIYRFFC